MKAVSEKSHKNRLNLFKVADKYVDENRYKIDKKVKSLNQILFMQTSSPLNDIVKEISEHDLKIGYFLEMLNILADENIYPSCTFEIKKIIEKKINVDVIEREFEINQTKVLNIQENVYDNQVNKEDKDSDDENEDDKREDELKQDLEVLLKNSEMINIRLSDEDNKLKESICEFTKFIKNKKDIEKIDDITYLLNREIIQYKLKSNEMNKRIEKLFENSFS